MSDLQTINTWINWYFILLFIVAGLIAGAGVLFVKEVFFTKHSDLDTQNKPNDSNSPVPSKPIATINFQADTEDVAKMNTEQLKAVGDYIDKLQGKNTQEQ